VLVSKELRNQLVFLFPNGSETEVQLKGLACSLHASLIERPDGTWIERTKNDLEALHRNRANSREQWISKELEAVVAFRRKALSVSSLDAAFSTELEHKVKAQRDFDARKISAEQLGQFSSFNLLPSSRFAEQLLRRIGLHKLAALPSSHPVTFEDLPPPGIEPLPNHEDLLQSLLREQEAAPPLATSTEDQRYMATLGYARLGLDPFSDPPSKFRVRVRPNETDILFHIEGFSSSGHRVLEVNLTASERPFAWHESAIIARHPDESSTFTSIRSESLAALSFIRQREGAKPDWLLHPDKVEPLDLFVRDALTGLASKLSNRRCFACSVSDRLWREVPRLINKDKINIDILEEFFRIRLPYEQVAGSEFIALRPIDPEADEAARSDRNSLSEFVRAMTAQPDWRLVSKLFAASSPTVGSLSSAWVLYSQNPHDRVLGFDISVELNRLLGAIPDEVWARFLQVGKMSAGQLRVVNELNEFIQADYGIHVTSDVALPDAFAFAPENLLTAPNENSVIEIKAVNSRLRKFFEKTQRAPDGWDPFNGFAQYICPADFVRKQEDGSYRVEITREEAEHRISEYLFQLGRSVDFVIRIPLSKRAGIEATIHGMALSDGQPFAYSELTEEDRSRAWEEGKAFAIKWTQDHPIVFIAPQSSSLPVKKPPP